MKKSIQLIAILLVVLTALVCCFVACDNGGGNNNNNGNQGGGDTPVVEVKDYAAMVSFNPNSTATAKAKATVHLFIDGDTTHFNVDKSITVGETGILKARYLAVNTPESTGKIEPYGHMASRFTKSKLSNAEEIYVESDDAEWHLDSTGGRHLVWVWYRNAGSSQWRNLNIELLQNGLAIASNTAQNRYGDTAVAALNAAKAAKLYIYSGVADPELYDGDIISVTIKELRTNVEEYANKKVAVDGVVATNSDNAINIEDYDAETDMYFGFQVYYGYGLSGRGMNIINVGNRVRIVGTVQYYDAGGTYQISDIQFREDKPTDPNNIRLLGRGYEPAYSLVSAQKFVNGKVYIDVEKEDGQIETKSFDYGFCALNSTISMENLTVTRTYTTSSGASAGAFTLTCSANGVTVTVRTIVLLDENGSVVNASNYYGKTINVKGYVEYYNGSYQIKVIRESDITIVE